MSRRGGRAKVSRAADTSRAGAALARPGMDTRNWFLQAQVTAFKLDNTLGPMADVILLPDGDPETVRVGYTYAGNGFGFYAPVAVDDLVVVAFPNGEHDAGGVIVARLYGPAETPPSTATANAADVCLHVEDGKNLRLRATGKGNIVIMVDDGQKVLLGDETGTHPVARKTDSVDMGTWAHTPASGTGVSACSLTWIPPGSSDPPTTIGPSGSDLTGEISTGSNKVESS